MYGSRVSRCADATLLMVGLVPAALLWAAYWLPAAEAAGRPLPLISLEENGAFLQALWSTAGSQTGEAVHGTDGREEQLGRHALGFQSTLHSSRLSTGHGHPMSSDGRNRYDGLGGVKHSGTGSDVHETDQVLECGGGSYREAIAHPELASPSSPYYSLRFAESKRKGPSPGHGHKMAVGGAEAPVLGDSKRKGPSPGAGHAVTTGRGNGLPGLGGIKRSEPSLGHGH